MEQFELLERTKLLENFDSVKMTIMASDQDQISTFLNLASTFCGFDATIISNDGSFETVSTKNIWNDAKVAEEDYKLLYLHSKGATAVDSHLKKGNISVFKNYYYWRQFMNWGVIEHWRDCVDALDTYDTAGVIYFDKPEPHYSGNFWWTKSSYVKTLPDPSTKEWWRKMQSETKDTWLRTAEDRFANEMWVCSKDNCKSYSVKSLDEVVNLSVKLIKRNEYT